MGKPPQEIEEYISKALQAGNVPKDTIILVVTISLLTEKPVMEVQEKLMDASAWLQMGFRGWAKKINEEVNKTGSIDVTDPKQ